MNTFAKCAGAIGYLSWIIWIGGQHSHAQACRDLQLYAGISITGSVSTVYSVEYVTDLAETNSWRCLDFVPLPTSPFLWFDKSTPATGKRFYRAVVFLPPTNMVIVPPGTFRMGSPTNEVARNVNEGPQTSVMITRAFWIGKYEVTQGEYLATMGTNPSQFTGDLNRPVESLSWQEATHYCAVITERERNAGRIPPNSAYRLPSEAEWEYACRAWTSTRYSYGDDWDYSGLADYAWYWENSGSSTHPVGQKLPNAWGLHDMQGNVWEWCQDWWSPRLPGGLACDPQGPVTGTFHVVRGCSWDDDPEACRAARRFYYDPSTWDNGDIGFRIVLAPIGF